MTATSPTTPGPGHPGPGSPLPALPSTDPAVVRDRPMRRFASLRTIWALVLREMVTSYGRSPGGYAWAVAEPVLSIALLSAVFSMAFYAPALGINFPLFYATGMLPYMLFNTLMNNTSRSLTFSRQLLAYPAVTYLDAILARFLLTLLTQLMVAYLIFTGILLAFETRTILDIPTITMSFALAAALALGIGTLNCYLFLLVPVWAQIWSIINRPMFLISGILFLIETIPQPYRDWLLWNPIVHFVGLMRRGFYPSYDAPYVSASYVLAISAITFCIGLVQLRRHYRNLLDDS